MKILMAGSEMTPFARTGGLGDTLASLPRELHKLGHDVCAVIPYYRSPKSGKGAKPKSTGVRLQIPMAWKTVEAEVFELSRAGEPQIFLIRQDGYFDRPGIYGEEGGAYPDNAERFIFFSKAVVELARRMNPVPELLHVHDWQTALVPVLTRANRLPFRTVLTLNNAAYQGNFWGIDFGLTNLPGHYFGPDGLEFHGNLNLLKGGILHADVLTTVSDTYRREILTMEGGCGLDGVLRARADRLFGFLNGADYDVWDPAGDPLLPAKFRPQALAGKKICRESLLKVCGLDPVPRGPVFAMVTRIAEQKGFDILLPVLDRLLADDVRLVICGEGDPGTEAGLAVAVRKYPGRFAFLKSGEESMRHLIEAGADVTLIPSRIEPGGLSAIHSLRYGAIPVAKAMGGLQEIVRDIEGETGWGFVFHTHSAEAFWDAIVRAKRAFAHREQWKQIMRRAMKRDHSWSHSATAIEAVYARAVTR